MEIEDIYTWHFDALSIYMRYFLFAGVGYMVFYIWKNKKLYTLKIQNKFPESKIVHKEIQFSIITLTIYCIVSWLVFLSQKAGITKIYLDIHRYGYLYFILSIVAMVLVHDTYFYWTHRLMHISKFFKWIHKTHHLSDNPTPWAAFSFHPIEAVISVGIIPTIVFFIPCHPFALFFFLTYLTIINIMGHLGYELFPTWFMDSRLGKWQNTSTNHNLHHQQAKNNFGLYFTFWDRVMGTFTTKGK
jgi:sterol desaturase/sphingolipid hydroxylase (fatty acid hydroxylase superfamily)